MSVLTKIKGHNKLGNPTFTIKVGGKDVTMKYGIVSVMVNLRVNRVPVAEVVLFDGSAAEQKFALSDKDDFIPGKEVIISAGYEQIEKIIFQGIITRHSIKAPMKGASTLMLELRDKSVKMTINRQNKYFNDKTDSDIISSLTSANGVSGSVDPTTILHKEMVQYYCTDWDFMVARAEANGMLVFAEDGKVNVKKPLFVPKGLPLILVYGDNMVDFEAEMDARDEYGDVTAKFWDYSKQEVVENKGMQPVMKEEGNISGKEQSEVLGVSDFLLQHPGMMTKPEGKAWASAKLLRSRMAKIKGRVRIYGTNGVKPGDVIKLGGVGKRFNGFAFVSSVMHSFSANSTWYTDINFGYSQEWFAEKYENIVDKPSGGLLPSVNGLVSGIVTDIVDTQGGEFRVRVRLPLISTSEQGVWARIVSSDAGNGRGILIRPEVDDEVILGFINDDPRDPVILGMVYSKKNKVPDDLTPESANKLKGWLTKSKIKLFIDDDKKIVTIETPGKNSVIIDDSKKSITITNEFSSGQKNTITMDDKGITLDTPKDIIFKSKGKITGDAVKDIAFDTKAKFSGTGVTGVEVAAKGGTATLNGTQINIG